MFSETPTCEHNMKIKRNKQKNNPTTRKDVKKMNMKKLISMVLALVMLLAMSATAFAEDTSAETYEITAPDNGHTYEVYQIFTGDLITENNQRVLTNVKWGKNGTGTEGNLVEQTVLDAIEAVNVAGKSDAEKLAVIKVYANLNKDNAFGTVTNANALDNVPAGYYLIKDVDGAFENQNDSYTTYIVKIVTDVTITPKADAPEFVKKVDDKNDSNNSEDDVEWEDSADYDIGDEVLFKLEATLPSNFDAYSSYKLVFHDKQTAGLTFNASSVKVYIGSSTNPISAGYRVVTNPTDGCTFEVVFDNLKDVNDDGTPVIADLDNSSVIRVEYTATLNSNAVLGAAGNPNIAYINFSNNPNYDGTGVEPMGKTPEDKVTVFTYSVVVNKVDQDNNPLAGAKFTLYKKNAQGTYVVVGAEKVTTTGEDGNVLTWTGLDDGDYKLVEIAPTGYNSINDIYFTITAEHEILSNDPQLTALNGGNLVTGEFKDTGVITTNIVNQKGATLPETGAQGTKMIYMVGGILVAAAAILLITKRRMNAAE